MRLLYWVYYCALALALVLPTLCPHTVLHAVGNQAYESELRDTSSFTKWKSDMKARDEEARLAQVEALRAEMAAAAREAKEAR